MHEGGPGDDSRHLRVESNSRCAMMQGRMTDATKFALGGKPRQQRSHKRARTHCSDEHHYTGGTMCFFSGLTSHLFATAAKRKMICWRNCVVAMTSSMISSLASLLMSMSAR